jgi:hypothetical protein
MITECRSIYWNSTTSSVQVGDFLYQNQAQTIPATQGYYSLSTNNTWAQCDAEGLVLSVGVCPNIFTSSFGYTGTNGNKGIASISGSICGFDGAQPFSGSTVFENPIIVMTPTTNYVEQNLPVTWNAATYITPTYFRGNGGNVTYSGSNSFYFTGSSSTNAGAMLFNGAVTVTPNTLQSTLPILNSQPYTIDLWFKTNTSTSRNGAVSTLFSRKQAQSSTYGLCGYHIQQNSGSAGRLSITMVPASGNGGSAVTVWTTNSYTGSVWRNLTVTIDGTNNASGVKMYVNGALVPTSFAGTTIPNMQEGNNISISPQIGNQDNGDPTPDTDYYVGRIGRLAMYNSNAGLPAVNNNYTFFSSSYTN